MPRPKGSKDIRPRKPRSAPTSNGEVGTDHNGPTLTDDQQAALLIQGCVKLEALLEKQAEITSSIRIVRKVLKADGFEKPEVDYALYLRKTEPDKAEALHRRQLMIAKWLAHPIGTQGTFDLDQPFDKAFSEGKAAGMAGESALHIKYEPGLPEAQRWLEGWHAGQAALMTNIKGLQKEDEEAFELKEAPFDMGEDFPFEGGKS